jgi:uncharacterized low-complexity protein
MSDIKKPFAAALGAAVLAGSLSPLVSAADNPFSAQSLNGGYDLASYDRHGEGKCGDSKSEGEGKCGEGSCGGAKSEGEGKCGEGSCGGAKSEGEGKCGEGKCGGA